MVIIYDLSKGEQKEIAKDLEYNYLINVSPDQKYLASSGTKSEEIWIYDLDKDKEKEKPICKIKTHTKK